MFTSNCRVLISVTIYKVAKSYVVKKANLGIINNSYVGEILVMCGRYLIMRRRYLSSTWETLLCYVGMNKSYMADSTSYVGVI